MSHQASLARVARLVGVVALIAALLVAGRYLGAVSTIRHLLEWIASLGAIAPLAFVVLYILACVFLIPGSIVTIGAGVLFGLVRGVIWVSLGATIGATCAFLLGRYLARDWVAHKIAGNPRFRAIDAAVGREGWKIVALTRLSPVFPFNLLNYAYGLTRVRLRDYVIATWAGIIPGTAMYVYIGTLAGSVAGLSSTANRPTAARWALDLAGFAATAAVAWYVARLARHALRVSQEGFDDDANSSD
jgi:uncharacterized membrane protein YdjX (TVP38/TMEM64 family)